MVVQINLSLYVDHDGSTVPWLSSSCLPLVQRSESFVVTGGDRGTVCLPTSLLAALSPLVRDLQESVDTPGHILIPSAEKKELVVIRQILTTGYSHKEVEEELFGKVQSVLALLQIKINLVRDVLGNLGEEKILTSSKVKKEETGFDEDVREESSIKGEYVESEELSSSNVKKEERGYEGDDGEESSGEGEYVEEEILLSSIVNIEDMRFEDIGENSDLVSEDIDRGSSTNNEQNLLNNSNKIAETEELQTSETEDSESFSPSDKTTSNVPQVKMRRLVVQMRRLVVPNSTPNKTMRNLISKSGKITNSQIESMMTKCVYTGHWICTRCGKTFNQKTDVTRHIESAHLDEENGLSKSSTSAVVGSMTTKLQDGSGFICLLCNKAASTRGNMKQHMVYCLD